MVPADIVTTCAALDHGRGVRFGQAFAIYSCAALPAKLEQINQNETIYNRMKDLVGRVCKALPVHIDLDDTAVSELSSLPVPRTTNTDTDSPSPPPAGNGAFANKSNLPWFLINSATLEKHCVIGRNSIVESLLVVLQRPWCVLEICCTETETIIAVREFALLAAKIDPESYDAAIRLLSHELRTRMKSVMYLDISFDEATMLARPCREGDMRDVYAATLIRSYNRFWMPLICCCAVDWDVSFAEVVRRIRDSEDVLGWITFYRGLLGRVGE